MIVQDPPALSFPELVKMRVEKELPKAQSSLDCQTTAFKADTLESHLNPKLASSEQEINFCLVMESLIFRCCYYSIT